MEVQVATKAVYWMDQLQSEQAGLALAILGHLLALSQGLEKLLGVLTHRPL